MGCSSSSGAAVGARGAVVNAVGNDGLAKPFKEGSVSDFHFIGKLGQGAFATVHKAQSPKFEGREVAVKVANLRDKNMGERLCDRRLQSMEQEVAILTQVTGTANVIVFYGYFREEYLSFVVMEKCDHTLQKAIDQMPAITEATVCRMLSEMLNGLASVHAAGIVHRDVKPDNYLCVGPKNIVKLCDFGLAVALPEGGGGLTGARGTLPFMSPEMLLNSPYDQKTDAWSFGVIVYSLFFGRFPYGSFEKTNEGIKAKICSGHPEPSFRSMTTELDVTDEVSDGARQLAIDLLHRNTDERMSTKLACYHPFFDKPGKTNLAPMLESAKKLGAFIETSEDQSKEHDIDILIQSLQRKREEVRESEQSEIAATKLDMEAMNTNMERFSRCVTSNTVSI